jgi:hypothetical protein
MSLPLSETVKQQATHIFIGQKLAEESLSNGIKLLTFRISETLQGSVLPTPLKVWFIPGAIVASPQPPGPQTMQIVRPNTFEVGIIESAKVNQSLVCENDANCTSPLPIGIGMGPSLDRQSP